MIKVLAKQLYFAETLERDPALYATVGTYTPLRRQYR
jgi:hypothetical protein